MPTIFTAYLLRRDFVLVVVATQNDKMAYFIIYFFPCTVPVFLEKIHTQSTLTVGSSVRVAPTVLWECRKWGNLSLSQSQSGICR